MKKYKKPAIRVVSLQSCNIMQSSAGYFKLNAFEEEGDVAMLDSKPSTTMA